MLLKVVRHYDRQRFNPSICCIKEGGEIADELRRSGYKVSVLNRMSVHGFDRGAVKSLHKLIRRDGIHVLRTHQYHANLYGRISGILARVPVIIPSFHNLYESPGKPKIHRRVFNYFLSFYSDALVAVSEGIVSDIIRFDKVNPEKIKVIYNGVDLKKFECRMSKTDARRSFNLPYKAHIVGSVGRLTKQKNHASILDAVSQLNMDNLHVVIAGDGPLYSELKELANRLKISCTFTGYLTNGKIPDFLKALDVFCFPSLWEGLPSALLEAMAAGIPIVASEILSNMEVLGDTGLCVPKGDSKALANAIERLLGDQNERDALSGKQKERAKLFSIDNTVNSYTDLFYRILETKGLI